MPAELDPRQIAAAHVGFPGEGLLTQATGRSQPFKLFRQGVHGRLIVTDLAQPVKQTIVAFRGQLWPILGQLDSEQTPLPGVGSFADGTKLRLALEVGYPV